MSPSNLGKILAMLHCRDSKSIPPGLTDDYSFVRQRYETLKNKGGKSSPLPVKGVKTVSEHLSEEQIDLFIGIFLLDKKDESCMELAVSLNDDFSWFSTYGVVLRQFIQGCEAG